MIFLEGAMADKELEFNGAVANAIDGTVRLLGDIERFGLRLASLRLQVSEGTAAEIFVSLAAPADCDPEQLRLRFARHCAVLSLSLDRVALQ
jgi:hypothetical protein